MVVWPPCDLVTSTSTSVLANIFRGKKFSPRIFFGGKMIFQFDFFIFFPDFPGFLVLQPPNIINESSISKGLTTCETSIDGQGWLDSWKGVVISWHWSTLRRLFVPRHGGE